MKVTTKTYSSGKEVIILSPDDGYKYVANNEVYSKLVYLGKNDSIENWHDTNDEPLIESEVENEEN